MKSTDLYRNPNEFMDLILKGLPMSRTVGPERINIESLAEPSRNEVWKDNYGRKWRLVIWDLPYSDHQLIACILPLPDGHTLFIKSTKTGRTNEYVRDLHYLTNFVYQSYAGKLSEWQEFLRNVDLVPKPLRALALDVKSGESFSLHSERLNIDYDNDTFEVSPDTQMLIGMDFFKDDGEVVWDMARVSLKSARTDGPSFWVERASRPPEGMGKRYQHRWERVRDKRRPFNEETVYRDGQTVIGTVLNAGGDGEITDEDDFGYVLIYLVNGEEKDGVMEDELDSLTEAVRIREKAH